jgi:DNA invertase Pin-like site-specific DNA recombinase
MSPSYGKFVAYFRVSTDRQGKSGLGLEAQRETVMDYLNGGRWTLVGEFTEVESGKRADRPELEKALAACKKQKAKLVIAKLDRLSRNLAFVATLMGVTSHNAIAQKLNERNVKTARGGRWTHVQVGAILRPFEVMAVA